MLYAGEYVLGNLLTLFIALKLLHKIDWSWYYVLMPAWLPFLLLSIGFTLYLMYKLIEKATENW